MIYVKHPTLGNKHVPDSEQSALEAEGWVRWPRTAAQKAGVPTLSPETVSAPGTTQVQAPPRKKPGRKPKVQT